MEGKQHSAEMLQTPRSSGIFQYMDVSRTHGTTGPTPNRFYRISMPRPGNAQTVWSPTGSPSGSAKLHSSAIGTSPEPELRPSWVTSIPVPPRKHLSTSHHRGNDQLRYSDCSFLRSSPHPLPTARHISFIPHATGLAARTVSPTDRARRKRQSLQLEAPRDKDSSDADRVHAGSEKYPITPATRISGIPKSSTMSRLPTPRRRFFSESGSTNEIPPVPPLPLSVSSNNLASWENEPSQLRNYPGFPSTAKPFPRNNAQSDLAFQSREPRGEPQRRTSHIYATPLYAAGYAPLSSAQKPSQPVLGSGSTTHQRRRASSTVDSANTLLSRSPTFTSSSIPAAHEAPVSPSPCAKDKKSRLFGMNLPRSLSRNRKKTPEVRGEGFSSASPSSPARSNRLGFFRHKSSREQLASRTMHPLPPMPTQSETPAFAGRPLPKHISQPLGLPDTSTVGQDSDRPVFGDTNVQYPSAMPAGADAADSLPTKAQEKHSYSPFETALLTESLARVPPHEPDTDAFISQCDREMEKITMRRRKKVVDADLAALKRRTVPAKPMSPVPAMRTQKLTKYERGEVLDFPEVYFCGAPNIRKREGGPSNETFNSNYDDDRGDYILVNGDHLAYRYELLNLLGKGSFGQVVRCLDHKTGQLTAVKIIRNKKRFHKQALIEIGILRKITALDPNNECHVLRYLSHFYFRNHLCIASELLSINLYEVIKTNEYRGFSLPLVRRIAQQLLQTLVFLHRQRIIHCDLKPENVLLVHPSSSELKMIDFGSSCHELEKGVVHHMCVPLTQSVHLYPVPLLSKPRGHSADAIRACY